MQLIIWKLLSYKNTILIIDVSVVPFSEAISHKLDNITIKYILVSTPTHQFIQLVAIQLATKIKLKLY